MPNLIVNVTFNPPVIKMVGTVLREETVRKLEQILPAHTTTHPLSQHSAQKVPQFVKMMNPEHWHLDLGQHYCDQLGRSLIFLALIETLESEDWLLKGTCTVTHPDTNKDTTKFFLYRA